MFRQRSELVPLEWKMYRIRNFFLTSGDRYRVLTFLHFRQVVTCTYPYIAYGLVPVVNTSCRHTTRSTRCQATIVALSASSPTDVTVRTLLSTRHNTELITSPGNPSDLWSVLQSFRFEPQTDCGFSSVSVHTQAWKVPCCSRAGRWEDTPTKHSADGDPRSAAVSA